VQKLTEKKFLEIKGVHYPFSFSSCDFIRAFVSGFAPRPKLEMEKSARDMFSFFGEVLDVHCEEEMGVPSTRVEVAFRRFPPKLANVVRVIFSDQSLAISWPKAFHPTQELALALDITEGLAPGYIPIAHSQVLLRERTVGNEPRAPPKPNQTLLNNSLLTSVRRPTSPASYHPPAPGGGWSPPKVRSPIKRATSEPPPPTDSIPPPPAPVGDPIPIPVVDPQGVEDTPSAYATSA